MKTKITALLTAILIAFSFSSCSKVSTQTSSNVSSLGSSQSIVSYSSEESSDISSSSIFSSALSSSSKVALSSKVVTKTSSSSKIVSTSSKAIASSSKAVSSSSMAVSSSNVISNVSSSATSSAIPMPTKDREGNTIKLPAHINRIISASPQSTEILTGLGVASKLVAIDIYSKDVSGISSDLPKIDFYNPDAEKILALQPDIIIVGGMSQSQGTDPFKAIKDAGVCVIYIPSSPSLQGIMDDIAFEAQITGTTDKGNTMISDMTIQINKIKAIGSTITTKKKVYFEIDSSSFGPYSFGTGVFLNEILTDIGATNIFSDQKSWIKVSPEQVVSLNPDVILSNDTYTSGAIGVIESRAGWGGIAAITSNQVFTIDTNSSSRPSQNIIKAMLQMAKAIYPDQYKNA